MKLFIALGIMLATASLSFAQRRVRGLVKGDDGELLPGTTIHIKGTAGGALTDINGAYSVLLPPGYNTLVFICTGYQSQEIPLGASDSLNVVLKSGLELPETVVTALAISREQKSVSYAIQTVDGEKLEHFGQISLGNALAGKIAGLQTRSAPAMKLNVDDANQLRGVGSLTGPKDPLFVIEGTPGGSINPNDVESVSVLKGPSAAALYGQRGAAGAVMVTLKKGIQSSGTGMEFNQSLIFDRIAVLPKYQNRYAGGGSQDMIRFEWVSGMPEAWKVLEGKYYHDYSDDISWGPKMEGQEYIPWYAWYPGSPYSFKTAALTPQPDNVRDFYETGITSNTNVNFSKATENFTTRFSFTYQGINGQIPTTGWARYSLNTINTFHLNKHFILGANINHSTTNTTGQINDLQYNQTSGSFNQWFHRELDMGILRDLRDLRSPEGILASWNHGNPGAYLNSPLDFYGANYWYNFFSFFEHLDYLSNGAALWGNISLTYKLNDHFKVAGFLRKNQSTQTADNKVYAILETSGIQTGWMNAFNLFQRFSYEDNYEILATWAGRFGSLSLEANLGGNIRKENVKSLSGASSQGLIVPDVFSLGNSVVKNPTTHGLSKREVRSVYARGSIGLKDLLYLDWSVRNDWSSTLPPQNNSYLYPGIGLSFIFSELLKNNDFFSFGKFRVNWAQVGADLDPYQLNPTYSQGALWGQNLWLSAGDLQTDPNIKPSLSASYEAGLDLRFLKNRAGINLTYYQESKINDILALSVASASGVTSRRINAGRIDRNGMELQLELMPLKRKHINWELTLNYGYTHNKVVELVADIQSQVSGDPFAPVVTVNKVGGQWGQLRGSGIRKIDGKPVLTDNGFYIAEPDTDFGSIVPDYTGGVFNTLHFKNFSLLVNFDFQKGGKYYSLSQMQGEYAGLLEPTAAFNDKGANMRDPVADGGGVKVSGVDENGAPREMYVEAVDYFQQFFNANIDEPYIYDLSFLKLREISLGYELPVKKWRLAKVLQSARIALIAQNLWLIYASNRNFDPSEIGWSAGEEGQFPASRSFGFDLKLKF